MIRSLGPATEVQILDQFELSDDFFTTDQLALNSAYVFAHGRCGKVEFTPVEYRKNFDAWVADKPLSEPARLRTLERFFREAWLNSRDESEPFYLGVVVGGRHDDDVWIFDGHLYGVEVGMDQGVQADLVRDQALKRARKIERAQARLGVAEVETTAMRRETIPDDVKTAVWQRDSGACVRCGSNKFLEFDHIIPLAMGGANSFRNLQLLCQDCNREKGPNLV